jgi:nickel/cobalt transporter (NiCoT) family protein
MKPIRKLYYNITITSVSVLVALVVGGIEALGLLGDHFHFSGKFWAVVAELNGNFAVLGYCIVALFALSWIVSAGIYKWRRFDDIELDQKLRVENQEVSF